MGHFVLSLSIWRDLLLLNGLDRLNEPENDSGELLPFDDFCNDFLEDVDLTVTSVSDDETTDIVDADFSMNANFNLCQHTNDFITDSSPSVHEGVTCKWMCAWI